MRQPTLRVSYPWWFWAVFALVVGFGTAQNALRGLGDSTGWSLVGKWCLIAGGSVFLVGAGWLTIEKFSSREASR